MIWNIIIYLILDVYSLKTDYFHEKYKESIYFVIKFLILNAYVTK